MSDERIVFRCYIPFSFDEWSALYKLSQEQCRSPKDQLRYIIRAHLISAGLINDQPPALSEPTEGATND